MNRILLSLTLLTTSSFSSTAQTEAETEIRWLIQAVRDSDCQFDRSGTLHSAESAANHLELKYSRGKRYADSAEAFIERLASQSSWTGEPYRMICEGSAMPAANWLTTKLDEMQTGLWRPEHITP